MSTPPSWLPTPESPSSDPFASPVVSGYEAPLPYGTPAPVANPYDAPPYGSPQDAAPAAPPYAAPQYPTPQYGPPQYAAPQYGAPQYGPPQYAAPQYGATQYGATQYGPGAGDYYARPTNGLAIASLVTSLASFVVGISAPVGLILGIVALRAIRRDGTGGRGLAIAGIVIGALVTLLIVAFIAFAIIASTMFAGTSGTAGLST